MERLLVDACFFIALLDEKDQYHKSAIETWQNVQNHELYLPWPILYEVLATRMARKPDLVKRFFREIKFSNHIRLDDAKHRRFALDEMEVDTNLRALSLVDRVIRLMIETNQYRYSALITYNIPDFSDVCYKNGMKIYPQDLGRY